MRINATQRVFASSRPVEAYPRWAFQLQSGRDREVPMLLRMFEKRLRGYRAIGYARGEAPHGYAEPGDDVVVEYARQEEHKRRAEA
jgi:hypothetical protein